MNNDIPMTGWEIMLASTDDWHCVHEESIPYANRKIQKRINSVDSCNRMAQNTSEISIDGAT